MASQIQTQVMLQKGCVEPSSIPLPDKPHRNTNRLKFIHTVLTKNIWKTKCAIPFLQPVDAIALQIPTYHEIVKEPMDLGTIRKRLENFYYNSADECLIDLDLMFKACFTFNMPQDYVYTLGEKLKKLIDAKLTDMPGIEEEIPMTPFKIKEKAKQGIKRQADTTTGDAIPEILAGSRRIATRMDCGVEIKKPMRDLTDNKPQFLQKPQRKKLTPQLKYCQSILKELFSKKHAAFAYPFYEPVREDLLPIPDYYQVIKNPMDFGTMQKKLDYGEYRNADDFANDMRLVFSNCYRYNPTDDPCVEMARRCQEIFELRFAKMPDEFIEQDYNDSAQEKSDYDSPSDKKKKDRKKRKNTAAAPRDIEMLQLQMKRINEQLGKLCDKKKSGGKSEGKRQKKDTNKSPKKRKLNGTYALTHDQVIRLSQDMNDLNTVQLKSLLKLLKSREPALYSENSDEIEIDLGKLQPSTLYDMHQFVSNCLINVKKPRKKANNVKSTSERAPTQNSPEVSPKPSTETSVSKPVMNNSLSSSSLPSILSHTSRLSESSSSESSDSGSESDSSSDSDDSQK